MKFSVVLGNLGNTRDRFLSSGYKESPTREELFKQAASIKDIQGVELVGNWDVTPDTAEEIATYLQDYNLTLVSIIPDHFSQKIWGKGAFTSRDPKIRKEAVEHTKVMIDILQELGGEMINIWPGQDGYDYLFQGNFDEAYKWLLEGIRECAQYKPNAKISLEFKPKEPRNFSYLAHSVDTLLFANDTGMDNVGVTLDIGHAFMGGENVAEAVFRLMKAGKLYHMHFNDNHQFWDDDMIVGSVHTLHYLEILFWLRKMNYTGWWSMDQYPYRENGQEAIGESIEWIKVLMDRIDTFGMDKIDQLVKEGEATVINRKLRTLLFRNYRGN